MPRNTRRATARSIAPLGLIAFLFLLPILAAVVYLGARQARAAQAAFQDAQIRMERVQGLAAQASGSQFRPETLLAACQEIGALHADMDTVRRNVQPILPLYPIVARLPGLAPEVAAAPQLLDLGQAASRAADNLCRGIDPLLAVSQGKSGSLADVFSKGIAALAKAEAPLQAAQRDLKDVERARDALPKSVRQGRFANAIAQLDTLLQAVEPFINAEAGLPDLLSKSLGMDRPRTYALLAGNTADLRATGGFITAAGFLIVDKGQMRTDRFFQSGAWIPDALLTEAPPDPIRRYMGLETWHLEDSMWWPDYPRSAQEAARFMRLVDQRPTDGVITFDESVLRSLIGVLGPVQVAGYPDTFSADNVVERVDHYSHAEPEYQPCVTKALAFVAPTQASPPNADPLLARPVALPPDPDEPGCRGDEDLTFNPASPAPNTDVMVTVSSAKPHAEVRLEGPDVARTSFLGTFTDGQRYYWKWQFRPTARIGDQMAVTFDIHDIRYRRKQLLSLLMEVVVGQLQAMPPDRLVPLALTLKSAFDQKRALVYFQDAGLQREAVEIGWAGEIRSTNPGTDYLYAVDTNLPYAEKVSQLVERRMRLDVQVGPDQRITDRLTLHYAHHGGAEWPPFFNWLRVYVPQGSELVSQSGFTENFQTYEEGNRTVFAGFVSLDHGQEGSVVLAYRPKAVLDRKQPPHYRLLVQKQSGTTAIPIEVNVEADGSQNTSGSVRAASTEGGRRVEAKLLTDQRFDIPVG